MSGSGRKSTYRKGVTKKVLYGDPIPKPNEKIVQVVSLRGSNLFEVKHADGGTSITMLPTKFRKLIWVKRGDYLIVSNGDGDITTSEGKKGAVTSIVEHILYKDQIKNLRSKGLWPPSFEDVAEELETTKSTSTIEDSLITITNENELREIKSEVTASSRIEMVNNDVLYMNNRNRRRGIIEDEEDDDEDDE